MADFYREASTVRQAVVVAEAKTWLHTPFVHGQGVKGAGVDCAWFLIHVYHDAGLIPAIDPGVYPRHWFLHRGDLRYFDWLRPHADQVTEPQPADVAIFRFGRAPSHAGIVTAWPELIHAYPEAGVCLGRADQGFLLGRLDSLWRCRGL